MTEKSTELAVIGAGPGGYAAAFMAADLGIAVTLIDPHKNPGGTCLYTGCIPSKALLHAAHLITAARQATALGIEFAKPRLDIAKLRNWKDDVVTQLTSGIGQLVTRRKIHYIQARAGFLDNHTLSLRREGNETERLSFKHAIIATGSRPATVAPLAPEGRRILQSADALALAEVPKKLLVVGGGYIGLELGTVYAELGAQVTVVEMVPQLMPGIDRDLVNVLRKRLEALFEGIMTETTVKSLKTQKNGLRVSLQRQGQTVQARIFDKILVAVGRRPDVSDLGLEHTRIRAGKAGFIPVDAQRRTSEAHIFAIGDVAGQPMLAHKAAHEGKIAAEVIAGRRVEYAPLAIPAVVFTDPEIAWAGITETEAKQQGMAYKVSRFAWAASGRAKTLNRNDGLTKLIVDPDSERILGVAMVGPGAGELIGEAALAIEMNANVEDLAQTVHAHPTLSETLKEAAEAFHGTATHLYRPKRPPKREKG
jgi:dihydrolipoamide dehydrogenase